MPLWETKAEIARDAVPAVEELLAESEDGRLMVLEDKIAGRAWVAGYFEDRGAAEREWPALLARLPAEAAVQPSTLRELADEDWRDSYKAHFHAWRFGRLHWVPIWQRETHPIPAGDVVIWLDPGLAFGTGTHQTTALCLEWLDGHACTGAQVIDYGCGSGILGIAALLLGAARVRAVDIDPQALIATRDNANRNAIATERLLVGEPGLLDAAQPADVLLANILAGPLVELAPRLAALTRPGGYAVLSGVLFEQAEAVCAAYAPWFGDAAIARRDEWCRIVMERRADAAAPELP